MVTLTLRGRGRRMNNSGRGSLRPGVWISNGLSEQGGQQKMFGELDTGCSLEYMERCWRIYIKGIRSELRLEGYCGISVEKDSVCVLAMGWEQAVKRLEGQRWWWSHGRMSGSHVPSKGWQCSWRRDLEGKSEHVGLEFWVLRGLRRRAKAAFPEIRCGISLSEWYQSKIIQALVKDQKEDFIQEKFQQ